MPQLGSTTMVLGISALSVGCMNLFFKFKRGSKENASLRLEAEEVGREVQRKDEELARLRIIASEEAKAANTTQNRLKNDLAKEKQKSRDLEVNLESCRHQYRLQADQLQRLSVDLKAATEESRHLRLQLGQTLELLKTRTAELQGAQAFLTKADSLSCEDVRTMVQGLNTEVFQTAAFMADSFVFQRKEEGGEESAEMMEAFAQVNGIIGERMTHLLRSLEHNDDPMLIQIAFQIAMLGTSEWAIGSWYFEAPEIDNFLQRLYRKVQEGEDQAVVGRWAGLTRRHVRSMVLAEDTQELPEPLIPHFINAIVNILVTAGCTQTILQIDEIIATRFMERLTKVAGLAHRINKATGEDITSCEIEVVYLHPGMIFSPSAMEDSFGNKSVDGDEEILGTTELGLVRAVKDTEKGESKWKETILLKPGVLLESALESLRSET